MLATSQLDPRPRQEIDLRPVVEPSAAFARAPSNPTAMARLVSSMRRHTLAALAVGLPVLLATIYYGLIAADIYVSEARFVVRSVSGPTDLGGLSTLLNSKVFARANDDTQSVNEYITSRDAIDRLIREEQLLEILSRSEADFIARFPRVWSTATREALFRRIADFIDVTFDTTTGISTLQVRTFRAGDSQRIARALLLHAENMVNRLNTRARQDAVAFANEMVQGAETRVEAAQDRLSDFRNREMVFDPVRQSVASLELISKLNSDLAQLKAGLGEVMASSPDSPKVASARGRIRAIEQQIEEQRLLIVGSEGSLAPKLAQYERHSLEQALATKSFQSALVSLENARQQAQRQQLYLERVVEPNLPDQPLYPRRMISVLSVLGFATCISWIFKVLGSAVLEHDP